MYVEFILYRKDITLIFESNQSLLSQGCVSLGYSKIGYIQTFRIQLYRAIFSRFCCCFSI